MQAVLEVRHLQKTFGDLVAVEDVSFTVGQGSCFGLLGPNGAGKTTTMEVIEGIIPASGGEVFYKGKAAISQIEVSGVAPKEAPRSKLMSKPKIVIKHGIASRTFSSLKELPGLGLFGS